MAPRTVTPQPATVGALGPALLRGTWGRRAPEVGAWAAWVLVGAAVLAQIAYPLVAGTARDRLTIATVCVAFAAAAAHCAHRHGVRAAAGLVGVTLAVALAAEVVGVHTGAPFGRYSYGDSLGPQLLDVPLVVPCAWVMTAYPALVVGRRLAGGRRGSGRVALVAGWALASWDLFLDPQMVAAGHWTWRDPTPALPGSPGIPLTNYLGWVVVSVVLMAVLDRLLPGPRSAGGDLLPGLFYLWTYGSQVLANVAFFDRPAVALLGGAAMGLVALPYAAALTRNRR